MIMTHTRKRSRSKVRRVEHSENRQTDRTDFVTFLSNAVANKCISLRTAGSRRTLTAGWVFPVVIPMLANAAALLLLAAATGETDRQRLSPYSITYYY